MTIDLQRTIKEITKNRDQLFKPILKEHKFCSGFSTNGVLYSEFGTKWKIPKLLNCTDLHTLSVLALWSKDPLYDRLLNQVYDYLITHNPYLKNLEKYFQDNRKDGLTTNKRDVVSGVASQLNYDDMAYFIKVPYPDRPAELVKLGEFAKFLTDGNEREDEDGNIESASFLLSKSTCMRIINEIVKDDE